MIPGETLMRRLGLVVSSVNSWKSGFLLAARGRIPPSHCEEPSIFDALDAIDGTTTGIDDTLTRIDGTLTRIDGTLTSIDDALTSIDDTSTFIDDALTCIDDALTCIDGGLTGPDQVITVAIEP